MILAIDTATRVGSVALVATHCVVASRYFNTGEHHAQRIFVEISEICELASQSIQQLTAVAVTIGPGSFTGLRIGLAAAKGICLVDDLPLITISTLETVAACIPFVKDPVCPIIDARKDQVYTSLYDLSSGFPQCLTEAEAIEPRHLFASRAGKETLYTGDGAVIYSAEIDATLNARRVPIYCQRPHAEVLGALGWQYFDSGRLADLDLIEPFYLRPADAKLGPSKSLL